MRAGAAGCGEVRTSLGVYVLGAIEPAERGKVEAHLSTCPACRDELAGLACLPALLGRVDEAQIAQVSSPSNETLYSLLAAGATRRRSRIRRWTPQVAAAVVILCAGVAGGMVADRDAARPVAVPAPAAPAAEQVTATDPRTHVTAQIGIDGKDWGTAVAIRLKGAPPGTRCRLMAVGKDGQRDIAAAWQVVYTGYADFNGSTMITRDRLRAFEISTVDGRRLLTIMSPP